MSVISELEAKKRTYQTKISCAQGKIKSCEKSHQSLSKFKTAVESSQGDFHTVNSSKTNILSDVEEVKTNSIIAQCYHSGMKNIFSGIGSKIIAVVYTVLLGSISVKLRSYSNSITDYDDDIMYYQRKIREIDRQIEDAKKAEELAKQMSGGNL